MPTQELDHALQYVNMFCGFITICANCKWVRTDAGDWQHLKEYIQCYSEMELSQGVCQRYVREIYPDVFKD